jgi:TolB-like protein
MTSRFIGAGFEIRPDERRVFDRGRPVDLTPRAFDLLLQLLNNRGRVLTREELLAGVWPGLVVAENNLSVQMAAVRKAIGPDAVATVPGRGYQFVMKVEAISDPSQAPAAPRPLTPGLSQLSPLDGPSIAVLPFDNLSAEGGQDHFVDGLVEDIITELSRFKRLFVIAKNSTFPYRGRNPDVRAVAQDLGVRYVLEGSVRRDADRVRVTGQLIDATSGNHVWAERYEGSLGQVFELQDSLTRSIVGALWPQIENAEFERAQRIRPRSVNAYLLTLAARNGFREFWIQGPTPERAREIDAALSRALELDPAYGDAWTTRAALKYGELWSGVAQDRVAALHDGLACARRAIELNGNDHLAFYRRAQLKSVSGQDENGLEDMRRAHALNTNDAMVMSILAVFEAGHGNQEAGTRLIDQAARLSPRDFYRSLFFHFQQLIHFYADRHDEALRWAELAIAETPTLPSSLYIKAISFAGLGRIAEARATWQHLENLHPLYARCRADSFIPRYGDWPSYRRMFHLTRVSAGLEATRESDSAPHKDHCGSSPIA